MDIRHARRPRTLQENDGTMRTSRESRGLWEQTSVHEGEREIGVRLPLDDNAAVEPVIADGQVLDAYVEVVALAGEIDQSGMPLRRIDQELVTHAFAAVGSGRCLAMFRDIDRTGHVWRGKPKVRGPVKQRTSVAKCLGAYAPQHDLPSITNHQQGSVFKTVGGSSIFRVG